MSHSSLDSITPSPGQLPALAPSCSSDIVFRCHEVSLLSVEHHRVMDSRSSGKRDEGLPTAAVPSHNGGIQESLQFLSLSCLTNKAL